LNPDNETAVLHEFQQMAGQDIHQEKGVALQHAVQTLRSIQVERLQFPRFPDES
jgi:hypothetical protein